MTYFTGNEHALVYGYYASDDECLADVDQDLDGHAYQEWHEGKALDGEYEDYFPDPSWD
jgi:hypothetical protein